MTSKHYAVTPCGSCEPTRDCRASQCQDGCGAIPCAALPDTGWRPFQPRDWGNELVVVVFIVGTIAILTIAAMGGV